ncbi:MAG TPA: creatininase family protein [Planctomycetota bacterium]|nr:creatininase family protein [Planctomycetota bacterium]
MKEWMLLEQNHGFLKTKKWEVAVLPCGATEGHNLHMPYGTDVYEVQMVADKSCEIAYKQGANVICLPTMPFGVNTNHFKVPGGLVCSVTPTTLFKLVGDIVDSMERQGIRKMLLLNGHGGNELKPILRELHHKHNIFVCMADFWRIAADVHKELFKAPGDHADEMETSLGLAFFPEHMRPGTHDAGTVRKTRFAAINDGWVNITRPWHLATTNTGAGDPSNASAEKGHKYMEIITQRLGSFLAELAKAPVDDKFPY